MTAPANEATTPLITPAMLAEVGVEGPSTTLEIDRTMIRLFARATGHIDPVYYSVEAAKAAGYRDLPCPPGYLGTPLYDPTGPRRDPTAQSGAQPSRPLKRILNGGTEIEYLADICAGDTLTSATHIAGYEETKGSIGEMLVVTSKTVYKRDGQVVAISTGKLIRY